jgi:hypothetical protein
VLSSAGVSHASDLLAAVSAGRKCYHPLLKAIKGDFEKKTAQQRIQLLCTIARSSGRSSSRDTRQSARMTRSNAHDARRGAGIFKKTDRFVKNPTKGLQIASNET